ncbi:hypothetical protein ECC02_007426 [Trypanosoma cruzi]|uniref:Uncharacterized protein n=1 Tax=Trypanosoma cruzi TaxID=5693 RepID=A0A7J6XYT5_TRYCR|nr:hypothetical protein ECC02_007426 [Trypanosoma cruzi]
MQKGTAALRSTDALPPFLSPLSPPKHSDITPHSRKIPLRQIHSGKKTSAVTAARLETIRTYPRHPRCHTTYWLHVANITTAKCQRGKSQSLSLSRNSNRRSHNPVRACILSVHTAPRHVCACACVFGSAYNCRAAVRHKRVRRRQRQREADSTHANYSYHHTQTHTRSPRNGCSQPQNNEKQNKKPKRGTTSAHTLIAPVKQNTHTGRERGRPLNAIKTKQKQLRCSAHAARQDGSGACRAKESTNGPAWVCMQYIQWAHYVCASWDEVRARVHARGHTQRVSEIRVCVRAVHGSLSLTLTRPPPQQQPHTQQQEEAKEGRWCGRPRCCRHGRPYWR